MMVCQEIKNLIRKTVLGLQRKGELPGFEISEISVEAQENPDHGDYSSNIAFQIAKIVGANPIKTATLIAQSLNRSIIPSLFSRVEALSPGFVNFYLAKEYLQKEVAEILKRKGFYGDLNIGKKKKTQVEFISANPTGPLTLGNGRGGFCGDVLANVLEKAGYQVEREYYINDRGEQIKALGHSVIGDEEAVYRGDYIDNLRRELNPKKGDDPERVGERAAKIILETMIKPTIKRMKIDYNRWFSEKSLYTKKEVDKTLGWLRKKGLVYEREGALWFKSTKYGDDKDRVLVKADGEKTYFASDVAYTKNKFARGFEKLIWFLGADHYGYVNRLRAVVQAFGYKKEQADFIVVQLVRLFKGGREVRMSKREGVYVTLDELFNELCEKNPLGMDVARFFFLTRKPNTHLNFDLDLAKTQSEKNPVYYLQYAYARICSILAKAKFKSIPSALTKFPARRKNLKIKLKAPKLNLLEHPSELKLIKQLIKLPEVVKDIATDYQVQRLPRYAQDLAKAFHQFYVDCRVLSDVKVCPKEEIEQTWNLIQARMALVQAAKIVLKNTLDLMGISAPKKM